MSGFFFALGFICYLIGAVVWLFNQDAPMPALSGGLGQARSYLMGRGPADRGAGRALSQPQKLVGIRPGQTITVNHPQRGELSLWVLGRITFAELWQRQRGPQVPWTPTGNTFAGLWLQGGLFLLNWQNRFYLLDERTEVSDVEIGRDFAPHARKFAQSDQTADVLFAYPPTMWHMDDIGKFRIEAVEGEASRFQRGAGGRFIHASGESGGAPRRRGLVVEDYEGGGQDAVWVGYQIEEEDIIV